MRCCYPKVQWARVERQPTLLHHRAKASLKSEKRCTLAHTLYGCRFIHTTLPIHATVFLTVRCTFCDYIKETDCLAYQSEFPPLSIAVCSRFSAAVSATDTYRLFHCGASDSSRRLVFNVVHWGCISGIF